MREEKLIIKIPLKGDISVKVEGHAGPGCKELSGDIEKALGKVTADTPTQEMRKVDGGRTGHRNTQGR